MVSQPQAGRWFAHDARSITQAMRTSYQFNSSSTVRRARKHHFYATLMLSQSGRIPKIPTSRETDNIGQYFPII